MILRRLPSLPNWNTALRELDEARREMSRFFDTWSDFAGIPGSGVFPAINVTERPDSVLVRAELPGIDPSDIDVTVENNTLSIAGERKLAEEGESVSYHRREREWGQFRRSFSLPTGVDASRVQAGYRDGVLTIELPKAAEARPKQIEVQVGS